MPFQAFSPKARMQFPSGPSPLGVKSHWLPSKPNPAWPRFSKAFRLLNLQICAEWDFFSKHLNILSVSGGNGAKSYPTGFLPHGPQVRHLLALGSTSSKCEAPPANTHFPWFKFLLTLPCINFLSHRQSAQTGASNPPCLNHSLFHALLHVLPSPSDTE